MGNPNYLESSAVGTFFVFLRMTRKMVATKSRGHHHHLFSERPMPKKKKNKKETEKKKKKLPTNISIITSSIQNYHSLETPFV